jgi:hypothetical protein
MLSKKGTVPQDDRNINKVTRKQNKQTNKQTIQNTKSVQLSDWLDMHLQPEERGPAPLLLHRYGSACTCGPCVVWSEPRYRGRNPAQDPWDVAFLLRRVSALVHAYQRKRPQSTCDAVCRRYQRALVINEHRISSKEGEPDNSRLRYEMIQKIRFKLAAAHLS